MKKTKISAKEYAFKLLSYRSRSVHEVRIKLKERGCPAKVILKVIRDLKRLRFLDDEEFARAWMESRMRTRPVGRYGLEQELIQKGIERDLIRKTLSNYRVEKEIEVARELARQRLKSSYRNLNRPTARRRLSAFLLRRGFSYDTIQEVLSKITLPTSLPNEISEE